MAASVPRAGRQSGPSTPRMVSSVVPTLALIVVSVGHIYISRKINKAKDTTFNYYAFKPVFVAFLR